MMWIVILGEDKTKKGETLKDQRFSLWVGLAGFEPAASSSRTKRATKLRYSPFGNSWIYYTIGRCMQGRRVACCVVASRYTWGL